MVRRIVVRREQGGMMRRTVVRREQGGDGVAGCGLPVAGRGWCGGLWSAGSREGMIWRAGELQAV
ncbi:MAG: hypothetical protein ACP5Q1_08915 [Anaerolineae bacterium]